MRDGADNQRQETQEARQETTGGNEKQNMTHEGRTSK